MIGYKLTPIQAAEISGKFFNDTTTFNPIQDINGEWFIFEGEINEHITVDKYEWVNTLPPSEYVPPINNNIP